MQNQSSMLLLQRFFLLALPFLFPSSNSIFIILEDFASRKSLPTSKWVVSGWDEILSRERMGYSALGASTVYLKMNSFILIFSSTLAPFCFSCHKHLLWSQCSVLKRFFYVCSSHFCWNMTLKLEIGAEINKPCQLLSTQVWQCDLLKLLLICQRSLYLQSPSCCLLTFG